MRRLFIPFILLFGGFACTDTTVASWTALGNEHEVKCYSGGQLVYEGRSTGRVESPANSDGWQFKDKKTGYLMEVSGDCIISVQP